MPIYAVPVTIVEYGRVVHVEASSPQQARVKAREHNWIECSDAERYVVSVVGATEKID